MAGDRDAAGGSKASRRRRALLVVNERSRSGRVGSAAGATALEAVGIEVIRARTDTRDAVSSVIRAARDDVDLVVVAGGDGTLNAAAPGILATGLPLGILPLGTANDLARTLGVPRDVLGAASVIRSGITRRIDLGEVNGHPYFNVASVGLGVDLTRALTTDAKRRWGPLGYAVAGLRVLRRIRPFHVTIATATELRVSRTVHLAVGNGCHYGGGITTSEGSEIDDGYLDVHSLEVDDAWGLLKLLPALRSGRTRDWTAIRTFEGNQIRITTRRGRSVNADGEIVTRTPATFRVLRLAVDVFAPPRGPRPYDLRP